MGVLFAWKMAPNQLTVKEWQWLGHQSVCKNIRFWSTHSLHWSKGITVFHVSSREDKLFAECRMPIDLAAQHVVIPRVGYSKACRMEFPVVAGSSTWQTSASREDTVREPRGRHWHTHNMTKIQPNATRTNWASATRGLDPDVWWRRSSSVTKSA